MSEGSDPRCFDTLLNGLKTLILPQESMCPCIIYFSLRVGPIGVVTLRTKYTVWVHGHTPRKIFRNALAALAPPERVVAGEASQGVWCVGSESLGVCGSVKWASSISVVGGSEGQGRAYRNCHEIGILSSCQHHSSCFRFQLSGSFP